MRYLLIPLLLSACAPSAPQARLEGELSVEPPKAICSYDGHEALIYKLSSGEELAPIPTGRGCDYEAFKAYRETYGEYPTATWRMETYREWQQRHGRDA